MQQFFEEPIALGNPKPFLVFIKRYNDETSHLDKFLKIKYIVSADVFITSHSEFALEKSDFPFATIS